MLIPKNNKSQAGAFLNIFIFMIVALIVIFISVLFIYMIQEVEVEMHNALDNMTEINSSVNYTELIDNNIGQVGVAYSSLYWIAIFLIIGMVSAIFIGSYMVTFRPVVFVPYIIVIFVAIIVAVGIANGYEIAQQEEILAPTFARFLGASFIMLNLPIWVAVIGITGGIIMVIRMKEAESRY